MGSEGWEQTILGDLGQWFSGGTPSKSQKELWRGAIPWISPKDMKVARISDSIDHVSEFALGNGTRLVPINTLLVVVRGMILAHSFPVALTARPVAFNQDIKALVTGERVIPEFLLFWLQNQEKRVLSIVNEATHGTKRVPTEALRSLSVSLPPLPEQRKIAAILSSVDEAIEKTQAVIDQVQVVKKGLMQELLTRGLPGRHTRFKQTEIGEIPEGWEVATVGGLVINSQYGTSVKCKPDGKGIPVLRIPNIVSGQVIHTNLKYTTLLSDKDASKYSILPGDLLMIRTNGNPHYVGRTAVVGKEEKGMLFASYLIRLRVCESLISPEFLHLAMKKRESRRTLDNSIRTSAGNYNLNTKGISAVLIAVPSPEEQGEIVNTVTVIDARHSVELRKLNQLRKLKHALMSVLLTGEVRVNVEEKTP